jgi:hypothetical protein
VAEQLPAIDQGSSLWLEKIEIATKKSKGCAVPQKYFDVLKVWGYVEGTPEAAKLTGKGMTECLAAKDTKKGKKKSTKKRKK